MKELRICIVALDAYPVLAASSAVPYVGGESVQHVLLARAWRDLGVDVSMVVHDHGQPRRHEIDGIRVHSMCPRDSGVRVIRFVHPHMTTLFRALWAANADIYYQSPASVDTGLVAWFCRRFGRRFVFRIASDANCMPGRQLISYWRDRKLFEYGMRNACLVAAQTAYQQQLLRQNYGLESQVISMAADLATPLPPERKDIDVLWVSNFREVKRPDAVVEIARALPKIGFTMVGGALPGAEACFERVSAAARELPNLSVLGPVPYHQVGGLYDRARLFLNTSTMEGFPNSFLQAWMRGLPVVSTFDPDDGLIRREQLGTAVSTVAELIPAVQQTLQDPVLAARTARRAHQFAVQQFSGPAVARRYLEYLDGS
jgi:glycosyltransferase involved in cell wall biosynthesis